MKEEEKVNTSNFIKKCEKSYTHKILILPIALVSPGCPEEQHWLKVSAPDLRNDRYTFLTYSSSSFETSCPACPGIAVYSEPGHHAGTNAKRTESWANQLTQASSKTALASKSFRMLQTEVQVLSHWFKTGQHVTLWKTLRDLFLWCN